MKKLTIKNFKEAKNDLRQLNDPSYGGFNLCYGDNYYAQSLGDKWGNLGELSKNIKTMEELSKSTNGAGI